MEPRDPMQALRAAGGDFDQASDIKLPGDAEPDPNPGEGIPVEDLDEEEPGV